MWVCECGHTHVIGSRRELEELGHNVPHDLELHRPYIDKVTITCEKCGKEMHRTPEVIDCWYDSGSMPFAQYHYPFEHEDLFKETFPANFISEAIDQTRAGSIRCLPFPTLLLSARRLKTAWCSAMCRTKTARKCPSTGQRRRSVEVLDKQGADAVRWYFYASASPWLPKRFSGALVGEMQRKFMGTL